MIPEIFRRCKACGVSFRSGALFCPQCGLGTSQPKATAVEATALPQPETDPAATNLNAGMPTLVDFEAPALDETAATEVPALDGTGAERLINEESPGEADVDEVYIEVYIDEGSAAQERVNPDQTTPIPQSVQSQRIPEATQALHPAVVPSPPSDRRKSAGLEPGNTERRFRPGMEKLRKGTSIVIDEASYDPSLRFILIAGILFLLFIVLLILSKWLG
jgi:hypothetical protein